MSGEICLGLARYAEDDRSFPRRSSSSPNCFGNGRLAPVFMSGIFAILQAKVAVCFLESHAELMPRRQMRRHRWAVAKLLKVRSKRSGSIACRWVRSFNPRSDTSIARKPRTPCRPLKNRRPPAKTWVLTVRRLSMSGSIIDTELSDGPILPTPAVASAPHAAANDLTGHGQPRITTVQMCQKPIADVLDCASGRASGAAVVIGGSSS